MSEVKMSNISEWDITPMIKLMVKTRTCSTQSGVRRAIFNRSTAFIPKHFRYTITLLHKGHPAIKKMPFAARGFFLPRLQESIQRKCDTYLPSKLTVKRLREIGHSCLLPQKSSGAINGQMK